MTRSRENYFFLMNYLKTENYNLFQKERHKCYNKYAQGLLTIIPYTVTAK